MHISGNRFVGVYIFLGMGSVLFIRFSKWYVNIPTLVKQSCPKPFKILDHRDGRLYNSKLFFTPACWPLPPEALVSHPTATGVEFALANEM